MTPKAETNSSPETGPSRRHVVRRRLWWSGGILAFIVVLGLAVFIGPRHAARYLITQELDQMGITHEGVKTVDIDLWEQEASFGPIRFRGADKTSGQVSRFKLKLQLWNLLSRRAVINSVIVDGIDLRVHRTKKGALSINGVSLSEFVGDGASAKTEKEAQDDAPWHAGLDSLQLRNSRLLFTQEGGGQATIQVDSLLMDGFRTWEPNKPGRFDLTGRLNDIGLRTKGEARPFADRITVSLTATLSDAEIAKIEQFTGSLGFERRAGSLGGDFTLNGALHADGRLDAKVKGKFIASEVSLSQPDQGSFAIKSMVTDLDIHHRLGAGGEQNISGMVAITIKAPQYDLDGDVSVTSESVALTLNNLTMTLDADSVIAAQIQPTIAIAGFRMTGEHPLSMRSLDISLSSLTLSGPASGLSLKTAGTIKTTDIKASLAGNQPLESTIGRLGITLQGAAATLSASDPQWQARLAIEAENAKLLLSGGAAATAEIRHIKFNDMTVDHKPSLGISEITVAGLRGTVTDKILGAKAEQAKENRPQPEPTEATGADTATPEIRIGHFTLSDPAQFAFNDKSVSPPVDLKIAIEGFDIKGIDSTKPSARSDVLVKAKVNEFTAIDISGWAAPLGEKPDFDLNVSVTGLELPRFSAYAAKAVGMNLDSGQLNLQADAKATQAALKSSLKVKVKDLKFVVLSKEDEKRLSAEVGMPVQTAVGLLQDSDNVINITIPVGGTVDAPDVDFSDAIGQAVGGALRSLFPPTALASMLLSSGKSGITFKPIPFATGKASLGPEGRRYTDRLVTLLTQRPKLFVRVCGKTTAVDLAHFAARDLEKRQAARKAAALAQPIQGKKTNESPSGKTKKKQPPPLAPLSGRALLDAAVPSLSKLALERTKNIRTYLLKKTSNIEGRVSECRSAFDASDKAPPRVDVSL